LYDNITLLLVQRSLLGIISNGDFSDRWTASGKRVRPMLGFKRFDNAMITFSGIDLAEKIKKVQFKTGKLGGYDATMTELWNAALGA